MRRRISLAGQLLLSQLGVVLLVVIAVGAVSVAEADAGFRTDEGRRLRSVAENLAAESTVRAGITDPLWYDALAARAESARAVSGATYVVIGDRTGRLVTGPDKGENADLGESDVLRGRADVTDPPAGAENPCGADVEHRAGQRETDRFECQDVDDERGDEDSRRPTVLYRFLLLHRGRSDQMHDREDRPQCRDGDRREAWPVDRRGRPVEFADRDEPEQQPRHQQDGPDDPGLDGFHQETTPASTSTARIRLASLS
jgi:hypothetical protein